MQRFWAKVERRGDDDCWLWTGYRNPTGYGGVTIERRRWLTHRAAWTLTNGPIPDGLYVCHACDNPPCCKPNVNPGYCWEPVIFHSARKRDRAELTVRDYLAEPITLEKGLTGAKPEAFCRWILDLLGHQPGDELVDLFPGSGVMGRVLDQQRLAV